MPIAKLDFSGSRGANPLSTFGDDLLKFGSSLHQQDKDRLAAERQNELLAMQKQEHQMKVDEVGQKLAEKDAANKYASVLSSATSGNVVGLDDQKKLAAIAQDTRLTPEQQAVKMEGLLPAMTKKYEASPEEQLKLVRASNPLGGLENIAPATRIALLKEAEAPMEKMQALNAAAASKKEEALIRAQERYADKVLSMNMQKAIADQNRQTQLEIAGMKNGAKDNTHYITDAEGNLVGIGAYGSADKAYKAAEQVPGSKVYDAATYRSMFDTKEGKSSTGGGTATSKKGAVDDGEGAVSGDVKIPNQDFSVFGWSPLGKGDTRQTKETVDKLQALGWNSKAVQQAVTNQNALYSDSYLNEDNVDTVLPPQKTKDGVLVPPSVALKLASVQGKELFLDSKNKFNLTAGVPPTEKQLAELGLVKKVNTKGETVLTDVSAPPVNAKSAFGKTAAEQKYGGEYDPFETQSARNLRIQRAVDAEKARGKVGSVLPTDPYSTIDSEVLDEVNSMLAHRNANNADTEGANLLRLLGNKKLK